MPRPPAKSKYTVLCDGDEDEVLELLLSGKIQDIRQIVVAFFDTYLLTYKKLTALSGMGVTTFTAYKTMKPMPDATVFRIHSLYCNLKNHPEMTIAFLRENRNAMSLLEGNVDSAGNLVMAESYAKLSTLYDEYWVNAQKMSGFTRILEKHFELINGTPAPHLKTALLNDVAAYFEQEKVKQLFPVWFVNSVKDKKFYRHILTWFRNKKTELGTNPHRATPRGAMSSQQ